MHSFIELLISPFICPTLHPYIPSFIHLFIHYRPLYLFIIYPLMSHFHHFSTLLSIDCLLELQVTMQGGRDAAQEAPTVFAAMDALAARAASFAERRQRALQEAFVDRADAISPHEAASTAAASVKQVTFTLHRDCKKTPHVAWTLFYWLGSGL